MASVFKLQGVRGYTWVITLSDEQHANKRYTYGLLPLHQPYDTYSGP